MARLLILTPQLPYPPHQGTSLRNYHIVRGLAEYHQITLLSYNESGLLIDQPLPDQLTSVCENIVTIPLPPERSTYKRLIQLLSSDCPDMAVRLTSEHFATALEDLLQDGEFDLVQVEGIELAWTIRLIHAFDPGLKIVFDAHNAEAVLQNRAMQADLANPGRWLAAIYSWFQTRRLRKFEAQVCREVDWVTAVSEADQHHLETQLARFETPITVIPNCIDIHDYEDHDPAPEIVPAGQYDYDLVFTGKMDYRPNVDAVLWFAEQIWPEIISQSPATTWAIVGQKPHARLKAIQKLPGITVTGWVEKVQPYLLGAKVFIMPFRVGGGTRLKLIEAFAAGKAVVSTPLGVEGFPVKDRRELFIAETPEEIVAAILKLLADSELRKQLGTAAEEFARKYDWRVTTPKFNDVYQSLLG